MLLRAPYPLAGPAQRAWVPTDMPSLRAWHRADTLQQANGASVNSWPDDSGYNNAPAYSAGTTGLGAAPTLAANTVGSKATVRFPGDTRLDYPSGMISSWTAGSVMAFYQIDRDPPEGDVVSGPVVGNWGTQGGQASHWPYTDGNVYDGFMADTRYTVGNPAPSLAQWALACVTSGPGAYQFYVNTGRVYNSGSNTVQPVTGSPYLGGTGVLFGGKLICMKGNIAEVVVSNAVFTDDQRQRLEGYLAHKWGVQALLPAGHPYKSSPPTT